MQTLWRRARATVRIRLSAEQSFVRSDILYQPTLLVHTKRGFHIIEQLKSNIIITIIENQPLYKT